jgi:cysteine desulfurase / selenocysteine lyase
MALNTLYCDNAATTFPKPQAVLDAVLDFMQNTGASPGRSAHHLALKAGRAIFTVREKLAKLFGAPDPSRIIFTSNATEALNLGILGLVSAGDRVAVTGMEHNSVMRPLGFLAREHGVEVSIVPCDKNGGLDIDEFERIVKTGVKLAIVNHGSNVCGAIAPLKALGAIARASGANFMVDAAQTAGCLPIDVQAMNIDMLAFSGHKGLYGPAGTGGLYIRDGLNVRPLKYGGTGSDSASDKHPDFCPDKYESGTLNGPGIVGLGAGIDFITQKGLDAVHRHGAELTGRLLDKLSAMDNIAVIGPHDPETMLPTVSIVCKKTDQGVVARRLSDEFGICIRMGLHCAPNAHRALGTFPQGTIRFSFGMFNTIEDIDTITHALKTIL